MSARGRLKVLLANPLCKKPLGGKNEKYFIRAGTRWPHSGIKKKGTAPHYLPFPFFLAYAAAWLNEEGFETDVLDCVALDIPETGLLKHIERTSPDIVFFESSTPVIEYDLQLIKKIKSVSGRIKIVLGGPHATALAGDIMRENMRIDFIIKGEYEETLVKLAKTLDRKGNPEEVKGIVFRDSGRVHQTGAAPLIEPLDKLPFPAREMFPSPEFPDPIIYWDGFCRRRPAIQMHSSRGCRYRCDFCLYNQVMYRNGRRRGFSPGRTVDEIELVLKKYGPREVYFDDDDFTGNREQVLEICREIRKRGIRFRWSCMANAANIDRYMLEKMAVSGCAGIKFGVETASGELIRGLGKPVDLEKARRLLRWSRRLGIKTHAAFTLGIYGEDRESIDETSRFITGFEADSIQISIATPFPGTGFYRKAESTGRLSGNWEDYDGRAPGAFRAYGIGRKGIPGMRRKILMKWFLKRCLSPLWLFRQFLYLIEILRYGGALFIYAQISGILTDNLSRSECPGKT